MKFHKNLFFERNPIAAEDLRAMEKIARESNVARADEAGWASVGATPPQARALSDWSALNGKLADLIELAEGMQSAKTAKVFRAKNGSLLGQELEPDTAIVGIPDQDGAMVAYYEGNLYGALNLVEFKDKAACAAGRLFTKYPTTAMCWLSGERVAAELEEVGAIDSFSYVLKKNEALPSEDATKARKPGAPR